MDFNQLSWGAFCFYYRSAGDRRYGKIMRDTSFLTRLRQSPADISPAEFEEKVLLDHVNIENYDLLIGHNLARNVLSTIIQLYPTLESLKNTDILNCDLSSVDVSQAINIVYSSLYAVRGLWLTGVSKIAHLLNDRLFVILNLDISNHFGLLEGNTSLIQWLKITQENALEATSDFKKQNPDTTPESYLSNKLGYTSQGYEKPLVKFLDEYFWLRFGDNLSLPPEWVPPVSDEV